MVAADRALIGSLVVGIRQFDQRRAFPPQKRSSNKLTLAGAADCSEGDEAAGDCCAGKLECDASH